jgi:hypothetical protein
MIPQWMKDYFAWHNEQRSWFLDRHPEQWNNGSLHYYLVECTSRYRACGGLADRLGPLPLHVQVAASSDPPRLLLLHWSKPAPLESFLLPPRGGVDWRVPGWLREQFDRHLDRTEQTVALQLRDLVEAIRAPDQVLLVRTKFQSHWHGSSDYDSMMLLNHSSSAAIQRHRRDARSGIVPPLPAEPAFAQVYHDLWRIFFTPVSAVAERIETLMGQLSLRPGSYLAIHLRALYGRSPVRAMGEIQSRTQNLIRCATVHLDFPRSDQNQRPKLLFVSDSVRAVQDAEEFSRSHDLPLVHRPYDAGHDPLHLDKDGSKAENSSAFFDAFVDIYMIGMSGCVAYHAGGFGRLGSMMSYNSSCAYFLPLDSAETCPLKEAFQSATSDAGHLDETEQVSSVPLFLPSMTTISSPSLPLQSPKEAMSDLSTLPPAALYMPGEVGDRPYGVQDVGRKMPSWMKTYVEWHRQQRKTMLTQGAWEDMRFLVMQCRYDHAICGGASDRLKPIPTMLRLAAMTRRLLLIQWQRPCKLEEFLLPPKGTTRPPIIFVVSIS